MAQFDECSSFRYGLFRVEVEATAFCFGCGSHDVFYYFGEDVDGSVEEITVDVAEVVVSACAASRHGGDEVGGVAINGEDHVAGAVQFFGVLIAGAVVKKVSDGFHSCLCSVVDLRC